MGGKTDRDDRLGRQFDGRGRDRFAVEPGAASAPCGKALVTEWIVNRRHEQFVAIGQRDRDAVGRKTVDVVGRPVERIDDPSPSAARVPRHAGRKRRPPPFPLLADEAVCWKCLEQNSPHFRLRRVVGLGDQVAWPLRRGLEATDPLVEHAATGPGGRLAHAKRVGGGRHDGQESGWALRARPGITINRQCSSRGDMPGATTGPLQSGPFLDPPHPGTLLVNASPAASAIWSISGSVASLPTVAGGGRLDVALPKNGLEFRSPASGCDTVLGVDLSSLSDHWLRGADVVAAYEPDDSRRLRSTVMWRAHGSREGVVSWEVVVSAQTSLLETNVAVAVLSDVAADTLLWSPGGESSRWRSMAAASALPEGAAAVLARREGSSCLVAVHPADARRIDIERSAGRCGVTCRLFAAPLEKGVLLRSRVVAAVGPAMGDEAWADQVLRAFAASPPPLTT